MKSNCKDKYNIKFSKSGVSLQLKGINGNVKRVSVSMKKFIKYYGGCKMKLFKTVDEKLAEIGFTKEKEDKYGCEYKRKDKKYNFTQKVDILYKKSGRHILQSYDPDLGDDKGIGNTCVGLTGYEMKLFLKKMKRMKMYSGKKVSIE